MVPKKIIREDPTVVEQVQQARELPVEIDGVRIVLMTVDTRLLKELLSKLGPSSLFRTTKTTLDFF